MAKFRKCFMHRILHSRISTCFVLLCFTLFRYLYFFIRFVSLLSSFLLGHNRITSILFLFSRRYLFSHYICRNMIEDRLHVFANVRTTQQRLIQNDNVKETNGIASHGGVENKSECLHYDILRCKLDLGCVYTSSRYRFSAHGDLHKHLSSVSICFELFAAACTSLLSIC